MTPQCKIMTTVLCLLLMGLPLCTASTTHSPRDPLATATPIDRDGDGELGEATIIRERIRVYRERHGDNGELRPDSLLARARAGYERWRRMTERFRVKGIEGDGWISLGPNNGAGRAVALAPHPTDDETLLVGTAGGGVWKTTDDGATWTTLTDGLPDLSVGAVTYAPSNPELVYVGTGEGGFGLDFISGIGLLRSEDGGLHWALPDEVVASQFFRISVDPRDEHLLLAATNEGLLRSEDGGATWSVPIPANPFGASRDLVVTDVVRSTSDPDLLYTALWCLGTCPAGFSRVMRSEDNGFTWEEAGTDLPPALSDWSLNRLALTVAPHDDQELVAAFNVAGGDGTPPVEVYRTTDGGQSWAELSDPGPYLGGQGWFDNTITIAPGDSERIVGGGVYYVVSANGGTTWQEKNPYAAGGADLPHVDAHDLQWQNGTLWLACDGGVWRSEDRGTTWVDCNQGLITRQYYGLAIDPAHRERILAGSQDNGTDRRRDVGDNTWDMVLGGDGFECAFNPLVPDMAFGTVYYTSIYRSTDGGINFLNISPHVGSGENAPFITPLTLRPEAPWVMYTGTSRVWRSAYGGDAWAPLSTQVTNGSWNDSPIWSVAVTESDSTVLMVAKGADVYRSGDDGRSWTHTTRGISGLPGKRVNHVEISPFEPDLALASLAGTSGANLYRTSNGGATWEPSADGLPEFPVQVTRWDPTDPDVIYAGTDLGLYRSVDRGLSWQEYSDGLPSASIHDVRILPDGSMVRVATHGRGVWQLDIPQPENSPPIVEITSPNGTIRRDVGQSLAVTGSVTDPDGDPVSARWVFTDDWSVIDGGTGEGALDTSASHSLAVGGRHLVSLRATDSNGGVGAASVPVRIDDPSDSCDQPRIIPGDGPFPVVLFGDNSTAGSNGEDPSPPCVDEPSDGKAGTWGSMWFELTPAESHTYAVSTCGSGADTVLSTWKGPPCGPFTEVPDGCNDDDEMVHCSGQRTDSYLELGLEADTTYRFMVGSYSLFSKGRFTLSVDCVDCPSAEETWFYFVPAAARAAGSNGTTWRTDLTLHNAGTNDVTAKLAFLRDDRDNTNVPETSVQVPASSSVTLHNVVGDLLDRAGSGAIRITASGRLTASSRTYNDADTGTFGQFIPAVEPTATIGPGEGATLIGLREDDEFRTNIGAVNTSDRPVTVGIDLLDDAGNLLATHQLDLPPFGWDQVNAVYAEHGYDAVPVGSAEIRNNGAAGAFSVYASVVDNGTGDPVYVTPSSVATPNEPLWVPAAAHVRGYGGSQWRTDVILASLGDEDAVVTIELLPSETDNSERPSAEINLPVGATQALTDVLESPFDTSGTAALRISVGSGAVQATSRTYNLTTNGTFGQFIAGVADGSALDGSADALLLQLRKGPHYRTNIGFLNLGGDTIDVHAEYYAADGAPLGQGAWSLPPYGHYQEDKALRGLPVQTGAFAIVSSTTPGSRYLAYASVVDDDSGDPVLIPAVMAPQE